MARNNNNNNVATMSTGEKIATYLKLKAKETQLKNELKALEESIKAGMDALSVQEVRENGFVARVEYGTQRRFDTTKFKAEHSEMYEAYRHDVSTTSFKAYVEA